MNPSDSTGMAETVVLVGHCLADRFALKRAVKKALPGRAVQRANDRAALDAFGGNSVLLLINRVLDGGFDGMDGVGLIRDLAKGDNPPRCLLITDLPETQVEALASGARAGFGKADLGSEVAVSRLQAAFRPRSPASSSASSDAD